MMCILHLTEAEQADALLFLFGVVAFGHPASQEKLIESEVSL